MVTRGGRHPRNHASRALTVCAGGASLARPLPELMTSLLQPNSAPSNERPLKAVVTILQCRRAVLPHLFIRYALPKMQAVFPGVLSCVVIQHRADASGGNSRLETLKNGSSGFDLVRKFTEDGMYDGADIIAHEIVHKPYPSIPSYHLGVKTALDRGADFHLWLEDDALVYDPECGAWDQLLGPREVGVYWRFHELNSAYLLTRRSFAERILQPLSDYSKWTPRSRIEAFLRRSLRTSRTHLNYSYATRYHHHEYPYGGLRYVAAKVRQLAPEAAHLLDLDFGPGTSELPEVTPQQFAAHDAKSGARLMDRMRAFKNGLWESTYRAMGR